MPKRRKRRPELKYSSIIVSIVLGSVLGWYAGIIIKKLIDVILKIAIVSNIYTGVFMASGLALFVYLDRKSPILVETLAFIFSAFVILQFVLWDLPAGDINSFRLIMFAVSLFLFFFNAFTGHLKWNSGVKIIKRAVGGN